MDYGQVKPGDRITDTPIFNAEFVNILLQMANDYRLGNNSSTVTTPTQKRSAVPTAIDVVMVQNATSDSIERFRILYVDDVLVSPNDNAQEFQRRTVFKGIQPTGSSQGRFGVLLDSLTPSQIGRIAMVGVTQCWINLLNISDTTVEASDGSYVATSSTSGSASILYVDGGVGTATTTGEQWATIKLGNGSPLDTGQFIYQDKTTVAQNSSGWRMQRFGPLIPNS